MPRRSRGRPPATGPEPGGRPPGWKAMTRDLTGDQVALLASRLDAALRKGGRPRLLTPLPRRTRARLAAAGAADAVGIWLCQHGQVRAARLLWRLQGSQGAARRRAGDGRPPATTDK